MAGAASSWPLVAGRGVAAMCRFLSPEVAPTFGGGMGMSKTGGLG